MVRITCPKCGAGTDDPTQKFCTQCGTELPPVPRSSGKGTGIPKWAIAGTAILVIAVAAVILSPFLMQVLSGSTSSAGPAGTAQVPTVTISAEVTSIPTTTPLPTATLPETTITTPVTLVPTTIPVTVTVQRTQATVIPQETFTVVTATPEPQGTSVITLAATQVPPQPPSDSYSSTTPGAPYIDPSALEARIHELINIQRQQNGLSTLSYDSFLADIARGHSWDMVLRNFFEHENPDGKNARARGEAAGYPCIRDFGTYYTEGISENIAMVHRYDNYRDLIAPNGTIMDTEYYWNTEEYIANKVVNGWMNSEGHRKNIIDTHFQQEGIGVAFSTDDKIFVTENFC